MNLCKTLSVLFISCLQLCYNVRSPQGVQWAKVRTASQTPRNINWREQWGCRSRWQCCSAERKEFVMQRGTRYLQRWWKWMSWKRVNGLKISMLCSVCREWIIVRLLVGNPGLGHAENVGWLQARNKDCSMEGLNLIYMISRCLPIDCNGKGLALRVGLCEMPKIAWYSAYQIGMGTAQQKEWCSRQSPSCNTAALAARYGLQADGLLRGKGLQLVCCLNTKLRVNYSCDQALATLPLMFKYIFLSVFNST